MLSATLHAHHHRMLKIREVLDRQLDTPLRMDDLARIAGLSVRQLERVFSRRFGESPRAYQRRLRLERAARRLRKTTRPILVIALEAGYESHESFTRGFLHQFGCGPDEYRRRDLPMTRPRNRESIWQIALAGGLRSHVECEDVVRVST